ncbi:hypothetical protein HFO58_10780 [Rhizobium leguminosarum]|uniref:hypothetical protein n=1 Tax=Rhizobium leguminosarum TaxID=384 RepID=UPI001C94BAB0|nr:hypothetical protein [Rhizobium leguminosarum]MBY5533646.1 hypothetical protein [Rhizobium leguminosarum]
MRRAPALTLFALLWALQACSSVVLTEAVEDNISDGGTTCNASLENYYLPKRELDFVVMKTGPAGGGTFRYDMRTAADGTEGFSLVTVPDGTQHHCISYRPNAFYSDVVRAKVTPNGLLELVYSNVDDQTPKILEQTAKGIALLVANRDSNRDLVDPNKENVVDMTKSVDPFDFDDLTETNNELAKRGYCIYVDPNNDPFVPDWMGNQCTSRKRYTVYTAKDSPEEAFNSASYAAGNGPLGILYKPLISHTLVILRKDDPDSFDPWRIWKRQIVEMPNKAPVFMLQVQRGLFTGRKTEINFDNGMLASIQVEKKSELNAVSQAFVNLVGIAVQIPAKALIIGTTEAENQAAVIRANQALLQAYAQLEAEQKKRSNLQSGLDESGNPRVGIDRMTSECLDYADVSGVPDPRSYCGDTVRQQ